ncbi:metal-dependent transcriptional regulator [Alicyclobacillus fastidiosus]|uniref:Manganese transport regulator n=1 Tax=Alicyclobacillus fastidiosus TaxID=392011 RepID=A0ABY6ZL63_9BACL|nr:metal-dependent transcriptional regulator [Alicyclobacillus fastidiosus]WAH43665.1 metal-dependent transcriptional regulator [Alicyclobacillus fastidiosus]
MSVSRTNAMDAYLEAIYVIKAEGETVLASKIADYLNVSRPTVSQTLQRMNTAGYVTTGDGKEVVLTEAGLAQAEKIVRRHRLLERWLTDQLGLDWADAHVEAGRLENSVSPLVEERLAKMLGNPTTCPHGNVIPGTGYAQPKGIPLSDARPDRTVEVIRIVELAEEDLDLLRYLYKTGFVPGARLKVESQNRFQAGVPVEVRGEVISLDPAVALRILVREVEA